MKKYVELIEAIKNNDFERVKLLVSKGADDLNMALRYASENGHLEIVKLLLDKGADINSQNKFGYTALSSALKNGHSEVAEFLKSKGAK